MNTFVVVVLAIVGVCAVGNGLHAWLWPQVRRDRLVRDFTAKRGLVLDVEVAAVTARLLVAMRRGRFVGAEAGIAVILGAWWAVHALDLFRPWAAAIGAFAVAMAVPQAAATLGAALAVRRAASDAGDLRVAHLPAPSLDDFLPPLMRWYSAALLAVSGVAVGVVCLAGAAGTPSPIGGRGLAAGWVASLTAVATTELAARLVLRVRRPAESPSVLAVQDEITGDLAVVLISGALGPALVLGYAASAVVPGATIAGPLLGVVPVIAERRRKRQVRERLWRIPAPSGPAPAPVVAPDGVQ